MGNAQSRTYFKIYTALPLTEGENSLAAPSSSWFGSNSKGAPLFANEKDKEQFVYAAITVITQNGALDLRDSSFSFRLLFSRRAPTHDIHVSNSSPNMPANGRGNDSKGSNERTVARLVAVQHGTVVAQIEPDRDGADQAEAFRELRRFVERRLDVLLRDVPGAAGSFDGKKAAVVENGEPLVAVEDSPAREQAEHQPATRRREVTAEAPPAYGSAVREWKAGSDGKK